MTRLCNLALHRPAQVLGLELAGMVCLAAAGLLFHTGVGLVVIGVELILLGVYLELKQSDLHPEDQESDDSGRGRSG